MSQTNTDDKYLQSLRDFFEFLDNKDVKALKENFEQLKHTVDDDNRAQFKTFLKESRTLITDLCTKTDTVREILNDHCEKAESVLEEQVATSTAKNLTNGLGENVDPLSTLNTSVDIFESSVENTNSDVDKSTELNENNPDSAEKNSAENTQENDSNQENLQNDHKPSIKLVDINKLVDPNWPALDVSSPIPKPKKSVKFDSSVIILTSSDDDTPKKKLKESGQPPTKSALKKTTEKENLTAKDSSSDLDSKENNKVESRLRKRTSKNKFNLLCKLREERKKRKKNREEKSSSSESEAETNENKTRKTKPCPKSKQKRREKVKKRTESSNSSEEETQNNIKLTSEILINLPRYQCEDLQKIYSENKEAFDIKRPSKINRQKNTEESLIKSSSDSEKPKNKKLRMIIKIPKTSGVARVENIDEEAKKSEKNGSSSDEDMPLVSFSAEKHDQDENGLKPTQDEDKKQESSDEEISTKKNLKKPQIESTKEKTNEKDDASKENDNVEEEEEEEKNKIAENENNKSDEDLKKEDSSDSEKEFGNFCKKKKKTRADLVRKTKKSMKKASVISDSDSEEDKKDNDLEEKEPSDKSSSEKGDEEEGDEEKEEDKKKTARRRIKRTKDSSSDDEDKSTRKQIRKVIDRASLSETTKQAEAEEKERKARLMEKQKKYNQMFDVKKDSVVDKVVLDYDEKTKEVLLEVDKAIVKKLKPHQASGVRFMWDACFESVDRAKKTSGSGCILAHCMGLGKTLQVITLSHTLLTNEETGVKKVMVVCPINTVLNWKSEFKKWMPNEDDLEVFELVNCRQNYERQYAVKDWHENGGVLIIGYTMFRMLSNPENKRISKKMRKTFTEALVDPGPDLVVCDEGHLLKNEKTNLNIAMTRIKTMRRIVLTGTPLQNNLREYWCMVQFIKPNLLGTYKEYLNRFVNPITNGQYTDSTPHDIQVMRMRSHVLHKLLDGVVQRRDYAVLEPYLPPKYEYVLFIKLTEVQAKLYRHYMEKFARRCDGSNRTSFLFTDFQELQRVCTHPRVLLDKSQENSRKEDKRFLDEDSEGSLRDFIDDETSENESSSASNASSGNSDSDGSNKPKKSKKAVAHRMTRSQRAARREEQNASESDIEEVKPREWWQEYCEGDELDNINNSAKLFLLFEILKECEQIGDKVLVFSQSLYTLNCIEYFLEKIDEATQSGNTDKVGGHTGSWALGLDYFRLDGSSSCDNRATWCNMFNNPENPRARLFLISTKAGGLGINLVAANRVVIFDVSWNPSHDIQSIYRVYRFGQTKPSYVYRFVTYGAMEMKIYERQVTKQAISKRVIDEQQIDRHYSQNDIMELYKIDVSPTDRPTPLVPKDVLLGELLQKYEETIYKYHEHQSLLENKEEECLNEEERKAAWEEFENEKVLRRDNGMNAQFGQFTGMANFTPQTIQAALANIVQKDNPTWSEVQIRGIIPALVQQMQVQLTEGDMTMANRVQQEMRLMQALHAQRLKEQYYYQQQAMLLMQHQQIQQQQQQLFGKMKTSKKSNPGSGASTSSSAMAQQKQSEVIELN